MATSRVCSIPDCGKKLLARGWCRAHYLRVYRHGRTTTKRRSGGEVKRLLDDALTRPPTDACILVPVAAKKYAKFHDQGKQITAHRYVCIKAHGPPVGDQRFAAHSCGQSWCVNPQHIRWATPRENNDDKILHGTLIAGEQNYNAKLKAADIVRIREMRNTPAKEIAPLFGVHEATIRDVLKGKTWKHV